ncbi:MAG TPA: thiamine pyrophosphate-binding protein [Miltoncostaeaceae bacterium]|nr:thiamine pyrophosphate-binding protein [Miltoncostaeaceae bacterium]
MAPRRHPARSLGEHVIEALRRRGVRHVFGVPGDFILGLFKTGADRGMTMVNSTREEAAVYAADGYARERGLGAAAVTFGVGALAGAAALGGSNAERVPVVLIAGAPGLGERDGRRLHHTPGDDIDAPRRALAQVVGETLVLDDLETALEDLECALDRCAHDHRPLYLELPRDLLDERPAARRRRPAAAHRAASPERIAAGVADVRDRLSAARLPVVWSGVGILRRGRGAEVLALAERMGAPVVESVMGKGGVDERHPLVVGVYSGASSDDAVRRMVERADLVLELGVDINDINTGAFTLGVREERRILADHTGLRVGFHDYPGVTLDDLVDGLERRPLRRRRPPARLPSAWAGGRGEGTRVTCDIVAERLQGFLRPSDILVSDVGVAAHLLMDVRLARARQLHIARLYVGMGFSVPAATGARLARGRGRPIVLVGDGSFQMTGMDLSTAVAHGLDPIVLVLDNHGYGAERAIVDGPFNDVARWDYTLAAATVGAEGRRVATPQELDDALAEAREGAGRAWLLWIDLDAHDAPRALRALGEGLEHLMHATH